MMKLYGVKGGIFFLLPLLPYSVLPILFFLCSSVSYPFNLDTLSLPLPDVFASLYCLHACNVVPACCLFTSPFQSNSHSSRYLILSAMSLEHCCEVRSYLSVAHADKPNVR